MHDRRAEKGPICLEKFGFFFVGGKIDSSVEGNPMVGHMYVEYMIPEARTFPFPVIMVHGGAQTGTNFTGTPDGREGWAQFFVRRGYAVYIVDQVARGRSAHWSAVHGAIDEASRTSLTRVERRFTAPAKYMNWPQAKLHTQFPGTGTAPDPIFQQFFATQFPAIVDFTRQQELNRDALVKLLDTIGASVLLTHSQSCTFGWSVADARSDLIKGIVAIEPNGPPVYGITDGLPIPDWYKDQDPLKSFGITNVPLTYDPEVTAQTPLKFVKQDTADGADLVRCWKQAEPSAKLPKLAAIPIVILSGEASYHAAYDHCTAAYLTQAGVSNSHFRLETVGIYGNGHMMMVEKNSDSIAAIIAEWLEANVAVAPI